MEPEISIDLNEQLKIDNKNTFFFRMNSDAMVKAGIHSNDILIVERSDVSFTGKVLIVIFNGEMLVRRVLKEGSYTRLVSESNIPEVITVRPFDDFTVWGIVTYVIHKP